MDDTPGHCPRLEKLQEGDDPDLVFTRLGDSGGRIIARGFGRFDNHDGFRPVKRSHRLKDERGQAQDEADRQEDDETPPAQYPKKLGRAHHPRAMRPGIRCRLIRHEDWGVHISIPAKNTLARLSDIVFLLACWSAVSGAAAGPCGSCPVWLR